MGNFTHGLQRALVSGLVLATAAAPAEVRAASDAAAVARAREWYVVGVTHFEAQRYERAALAFDEAYALDPNPLLLWNAGRAWEEVGRLDLAKARYVALLAGADAEPKVRQRAAEQLARVDEKLARQLRGELEEELAESQRLAREAERDEAAAAEQRLREQLREEMRAEVQRAMAERPPEQVRQAERVIVVSLPPDHQDTTVVRRAQPRSSSAATFGWASVTIGALVAGTGGGFLLWADGLRDDVRGAERDDAGLVVSLTQREAHERRDDADTLSTLGVAGLAVGGAALVVGLVLVAASDPDSAPPAVVGAAPLPGGAAVSSTWSF